MSKWMEFLCFPQGRLPVKWMAPEALFDRIYTHHSDVYVSIYSLKLTRMQKAFVC